MRPKEPELDRFGFPVPCSFDELGPASGSAPKGNVGARIRWVLRMAIVAAIGVALWNHFDVGPKLRDGFAGYLHGQAVRLYHKNDLPGALAAADRAVRWSPENADILWTRCQLRRLSKDYQGALEDAEQIAALDPAEHEVHEMRRELCFLMHDHRKSVDIVTELLGKGIGQRAMQLNNRAYSRALGDFELEGALADIDEAISLTENPNSSYIDTRAYVLYRLKKYPEALKEINLAIEMTERAYRKIGGGIDLFHPQRRNGRFPVEQLERVKENLAVMYHHRGEIYQEQGKTDEATKDFAIADQFGFDPENGIY